MHICILQTVLDPYKGANHLPLYAELSDVQFTIVCNRSKATAEDLPPNVHVVTVPGRTGSYYYGFADYLFARQVLKKYPPNASFWKQFNVLHLNQVMGPAFKKLQRAGVPIMFLIHHPVTADNEVATSEEKGLRSLHWRLKYFLLTQWQRRMCHIVSKVVTVSETMKKRIAADYNCSLSNIAVVLNGVSGTDFPLVADSECQNDIVAVGSFLHPRKGFTYLLEVYKQLAHDGKHIADVGRRSDEQRKQLEAIPGVSVYGTVSSEELRDIVAHSRVLVSTSLFEGFGLSLIEALSCGHPAFAFAVGAVPEVLGTIDSTLIVSPKDTIHMTHAIRDYLACSTKERDSRGKHYREAVLSKFSLASSAEQLRCVYEDIAAKH